MRKDTHLGRFYISEAVRRYHPDLVKRVMRAVNVHRIKEDIFRLRIEVTGTHPSFDPIVSGDPIPEYQAVFQDHVNKPTSFTFERVDK